MIVMNKTAGKALMLSIALFFSLLSLRGQTHARQEADSILEIISSLPDDTVKFEQLLELSWVYYSARNYDSAVFYNETARKLAGQLNYPAGMANAIYRQALIDFRRGDYSAAIDKTESMLFISDSLEDKASLAKGYWLYGTLLTEQGDVEAGINCYKISRNYYESYDDSVKLLSVYNSIGNSYLAISEFDSAVFYYHKALGICEKLGHDAGVIAILNNLGRTILYQPRIDFDLSQGYLLQSLSISKKLNRRADMAKSYSHLGSLFNIVGELDTATYYYQLAYDIQQELGDVVGIVNYYNNMGEIYEKQGKLRAAYQNYQNALSYYRKQDIKEGITVSLLNIADILSDEKNFRLAYIYYDSALEMSRIYNIRHLHNNALQNKSWAYYQSGNYKRAYDFLTRYYDTSDSIFNVETKERLDELKLKYEKEKDQATILRLEKLSLQKDLDLKKRTSQRNIILFLGISAVLLALFIFLYLRQKAVKDRIIAMQRIRQLEEEKKVLAAKALVEGQEEERKRIARELHDGLGVLLSTVKMQFTSIKDKSPENQPLIERASQLLEQASGDVRKISHNMMPGLLTKLGLCEAVEDLFEKVSETEGLDVEVEVPEDAERLPENKEIMLYRVIQEMVNNTLKHAGARKITIRLLMQPGGLEVFYSDNGKGFDVEEKLKSKSIGLQSIQSRVNFLNGSLDFDSAAGKGVVFIIRIPLDN